ncbi:MAG: 2OG-Fe(II) oxygenase [Gammaproteobacteria bacterium]|jgi:Rps23 Pro-64 3,4-dihydroxylase Tpa1-like proline 4-hydroxylase
MTLLNLSAFENAPLQHDPFDFLIAEGVMSPETLAKVNADYPAIDLPANFRPEDLKYGPAFEQLLEELDSPEFQAAVERKFDVSLASTEKTVTVRKYSEMSDGNIHTDHWSKIITVLVYFNPEWTQEGGKLRMLRSKTDIDDYAAEATPVGGTLLAFRRSNRSFHGYRRFEGERRMVQVNWIRSGRFAWYAQQLARLGTHTGKRLLRVARGS